MPDEIIKNEAKKAVQLSNAEVQPIVTILDIPPERAARRTQIALSEVDDLLLFGLKEKYKQNLINALGQAPDPTEAPPDGEAK